MVACVVDALNLLFMDYTNGLDECVGRLQRRLFNGRFSWSGSFLVELGLAERVSKNATVFFFRRSVAKRGPSSQAFLMETVETGDKNRDDFHCMQMTLWWACGLFSEMTEMTLSFRWGSEFSPTSSGKNIKSFILVEGSSVLSDPMCEAEVFSAYFANIIQVAHRSDTDYTDHPSIKAISNRRFSSELNYSLVSTSYIRNILDHLNPRKAVGVDGISPRLLHLGSLVLTEEVTNLIDFCTLIGYDPSEWKQARLTPVLN